MGREYNRWNSRQERNRSVGQSRDETDQSEKDESNGLLGITDSSRSQDKDKVAKMFVQWQKWRSDFVPRNCIIDSEVEDELSAEKVYLQGASRQGHPVVIVKGNKHISGNDQLHSRVTRMVVSTYQAASGAGAAAMEELELQTREVLEGKEPTCQIFNQQYAFNLFSHNAPVLSNGYNEEEMKLVKETRKIWNDKNVKVTATCIRVPVMRAHAASVNLQFETHLDEAAAREILSKAPGVVVIDDRAANKFPTPLEVSNNDDVAVGRIRQDVSQYGNYGLI